MPTRVTTAADLAERLQVPVSYLGSLCRRLGLAYDGPDTPLPPHAESLVRSLMEAGPHVAAPPDPYIDPRLLPATPLDRPSASWPAWAVPASAVATTTERHGSTFSRLARRLRGARR